MNYCVRVYTVRFYILVPPLANSTERNTALLVETSSRIPRLWLTISRAKSVQLSFTFGHPEEPYFCLGDSFFIIRAGNRGLGLIHRTTTHMHNMGEQTSSIALHRGRSREAAKRRNRESLPIRKSSKPHFSER